METFFVDASSLKNQTKTALSNSNTASKFVISIENKHFFRLIFIFTKPHLGKYYSANSKGFY